MSPYPHRMKTATLGRSTLRTSNLAYGCWRLAGTQEPTLVTPEKEAAGIAAVHAAYEAGYRLFDHADIYCNGSAESIFGKALVAASGMREQILIATKCGIRQAGEPTPEAPYRYDSSADYIVGSCEQSLVRLGVETIDLYQLHRPDLLADPAEVAGAFDRLRQAGKVREFGVSNCRPSQVTLLQKACSQPLVVNQVEISLVQLEPVQNGTLDQCLTEGLTPLAWSPLAGGRLAPAASVSMQDSHHAERQRLLDAIDHVARERGTSRSVIALAWLRKHPSGIIPIVGTTQPDRIREAATAADLELSREEWYLLYEAALGQRLP